MSLFGKIPILGDAEKAFNSSVDFVGGVFQGKLDFEALVDAGANALQATGKATGNLGMVKLGDTIEQGANIFGMSNEDAAAQSRIDQLISLGKIVKA